MGSKFFMFLMILSILLVLVEFKPDPKDCVMEFDTEYLVESDDGRIITARHHASEAVELVIIRYKTDVEIYQCGSNL